MSVLDLVTMQAQAFLTRLRSRREIASSLTGRWMPGPINSLIFCARSELETEVPVALFLPRSPSWQRLLWLYGKRAGPTCLSILVTLQRALRCCCLILLLRGVDSFLSGQQAALGKLEHNRN